MTPESLRSVREWFRAEARVYPWTTTDDPYAIWISEVMLQQTVVTAAVAPYQRWLRRWPDVATLAAATEDEVLRAWEGLGYASRAKNLHKAARVLNDRGHRSLPSDEDELRALPGIGEYTAAAIRSFAFHQPTLTLDANLKRVFQRLDAEPLWTPDLESRWRALWAQLVDGPGSRESNQAVMQLGQLVCRSQSPGCGICPLSSGCRAFQTGRTAQIPVAKARSVEEKATTVVFWRRSDPELWWFARPLSGRFSNLWLAPPGDTASVRDVPAARPLSARVHTYTRYRDRLSPWVAPWSAAVDPPLPPGWVGRWVDRREAQSLGMVSVYRALWIEANELTLL